MNIICRKKAKKQLAPANILRVLFASEVKNKRHMEYLYIDGICFVVQIPSNALRFLQLHVILYVVYFLLI